MEYVLGIDIGTSGAKVLLMSVEGEIISSKVEDYDIYSPHPGWSEENPDTWWKAIKKCIKEIKKRHDKELSNVKSIGLSGQMHGAVFVDKEGKPLYPCIIWADNRTDKECKEIIDIVGEERIKEITYNPVIPAYTAPKVLWFKKNKKELYEKTYKIIMPKDYIGFKLTGTFYTDYSDASGTLLFDLTEKSWSEEIFEKLGLDITKHPDIYQSSAVIGTLTDKAAYYLGLKPGIIVVAGGGDLVCGAIGNANTTEGMASVTIGTAGQVVATMDQIYSQTVGKLFNFCHGVEDKYFTLASVLSAGLSLKWFKNNISLIENLSIKDTSIDSFDLLLEGIEKIPPGSNGIIFLPYLNGAGTPYMDHKAKGAFIGLTANHNKKEIVRSIIEGVTFGIRECLETISKVGIDIREVIISAGGAKNPKWRQIQADIYNKKVSTLKVTDTSPLGAAILATVGLGKFKTIQEASRFYVKRNEELIPNQRNKDIYNYLFNIYRKVYSSLKEINDDLNDFMNK
ncbi:MAG: xylulokinase [Halanaerobiales bacterium]|nr:xylulokinase [Halanaerobiales bacterium]